EDAASWRKGVLPHAVGGGARPGGAGHLRDGRYRRHRGRAVSERQRVCVAGEAVPVGGFVEGGERGADVGRSTDVSPILVSDSRFVAGINVAGLLCLIPSKA